MQKLRAFALSLSVQLDIVQQTMLGSLQNVSCLTCTNPALSRVTLPVPWELFIMTIYICSVQEQPKEKGVQRLSAFGAKQSGNFTHSEASGKSAAQHQRGIFSFCQDLWICQDFVLHLFVHRFVIMLCYQPLPISSITASSDRPGYFLAGVIFPVSFHGEEKDNSFTVKMMELWFLPLWANLC